MFEVETENQTCYIRYLQFKEDPKSDKIPDDERRKRVVGSLMELTDWVQQDLKYEEMVMGLDLIVLRLCKFKEQNFYQTEWIHDIREPFYYDFSRKRSFTDPMDMFYLLGFNEYGRSKVQEKVLYNKRFKCSVHIHRTMPTRPHPRIKAACIIQIRQYADKYVDLKYGIGSCLEQKLKKDKVAEHYPITLSGEEVGKRLRPPILQMQKNLNSLNTFN